MSNNQTTVIIQARYGSTRLPGKILKRINDRTILSFVIERALRIPNADKVICAIPDSKENDVVAEEARKYSISVIRGSENDVLDRYLQAAISQNSKYIIRITSDCPLIDPKVCGNVLDLLHKREADYACNASPPSFPHGLDCEAFVFEWLERSANEAKKPSEREHVTQFMKNHTECKKVNLMGPGGKIVNYRWTIDTEADLRFLKALYNLIPTTKNIFDYEELITIIENKPDLIEINAGYDRYYGLRKSLIQDEKAGFLNTKRD